MPTNVCESWTAVLPIIDKKNFIGWNHPSVKTRNCYDYCVKQLGNAGYKLRSPGWGAKQIGGGGIYQTYLASNIGKMKKGFQQEAFIAGVNYLKKAIFNKIPVMVGVEHSSGASSADKVTDHYVIVVGMGTDSKGKYFSFYDNSTGDIDVGTSSDNRIYVNCEDFSLIGVGSADNSYIMSGYGKYIVTQIRESIPKK